MYKLDKSGGAVFSLHYHLICCVKYRQKVFDNDEIISDIKSQICKIAKTFNVEITEPPS